MRTLVHGIHCYGFMLAVALALCGGCRSGTPVEIVQPAAGAQFAGGRQIVFSAVTRNFEGSRVTARWDFGDGTAAEGFTAMHAYDRQGFYTVTVTVTNEFTSTASDNLTLDITSSRFVKLSADGAELPDDAGSWAMVDDAMTGLVWEVKNSRDFELDYGNPHDADNTYSWYDDNPLSNGGDSGAPGDGTDTADFIEQLNDEAFGGFSNWRLPGCSELASLQDRTRSNPAINTDYFPGTAPWYYWSATTYADFTYAACHIDFMGRAGSVKSIRSVRPFNHYGYKTFAYHARAVRSAD